MTHPKLASKGPQTVRILDVCALVAFYGSDLARNQLFDDQDSRFNRSLQAAKCRDTAVHSRPQHSIPNSTLAAPSKSDHRQYGGVHDYVSVQHHVTAVLPMIPKDLPSCNR